MFNILCICGVPVMPRLCPDTRGNQRLSGLSDSGLSGSAQDAIQRRCDDGAMPRPKEA
jgi:hypothetical protein